LSKSSLVLDLINPEKEAIKAQCKFGRTLRGLPDDEQEALLKAIVLVRESDAQGKCKVYSSVWLSKVLRKNGYLMSVSTIQRHINKECYCEESGE